MSERSLAPGSVIGILGGGQLGRMTCLAAAEMGYQTHVYAPREGSEPAAEVATEVSYGDYEDLEALLCFAEKVDVVTYEFENVSPRCTEILMERVPLCPHPRALCISRNRRKEKEYCRSLGIPTAPFWVPLTLGDLEEAVEQLGEGGGILKTCELGYDGKGQLRVKKGDPLREIWESFEGREVILEGIVPFKLETSVILARSGRGEVRCFPMGENEHEEGILRRVKVPGAISQETQSQAFFIAQTLAESFDLVGLLTVEFFVLEGGDVVVNELAPRPHNSGHWTQDACVTSQFEQLIRAICNLPLGAVDVLSPVVMENLIGEDVLDRERLLRDPLAKVHLYGKKEVRKGRKMGHVNRMKHVWA